MFNHKNFSVMAYSNGFTLWNYVTADTPAAVKKAGYFNAISPFARAGDMIFVISTAPDGTANTSILTINKIAQDSVKITNLVKA